MLVISKQTRFTPLTSLMIRALIRASWSLVPRHETLFAQVSPGNTASVRAFLAAAYQPICSEVVFLKRDFA